MAKILGRIPLSERVRQLDRVYGAAERAIIKELALMDIGNYQELRAVKTQEKIDGIIKMLNTAAIKWTKKAVPEAYVKAEAIARTRLEILGATKSDEFPEKTHSQTIDEEIDTTMEVLIKANLSIRLNVATFLYLAKQAATGLSQLQAFDMRDEEFIDDLIGETLRKGGTRGEASKIIREYFREQFGEAKFININGRNYNLRKYADGVAKTRLRVVQTDAVLNSCKEYENDLVQVSDHGTSTPICIPYEGNVYSLSGKHPVYPYLDAYTPFHFRCQHNIMPTSEVVLEAREIWG